MAVAPDHPLAAAAAKKNPALAAFIDECRHRRSRPWQQHIGQRFLRDLRETIDRWRINEEYEVGDWPHLPGRSARLVH
jgi:hypothetical protein